MKLLMNIRGSIQYSKEYLNNRSVQIPSFILYSSDQCSFIFLFKLLSIQPIFPHKFIQLKRMFENLALRGMLSVMGAFMITLSVGVMYLWGIITIYGTSYFRIVMKDSTLTQDQTDIVFPLMLLGQAISMPFVTRYARKISPSMTCFVVGIAMSSIMYLSSLAQDYTSFALLFGLGNGIAIGIIYILPIGHCYQFFPKKKTTISIIITSASGIGTLIFSLIAIDCMNFANKSLDQAGYNLYYGKEVSDKFPDFLRIMSGVTLGFVSGGGLLLFQFPAGMDKILKKEIVQVESKKENLASLMDLQFVLEIDEVKEPHRNPFGNMNYQLSNMAKGFDHQKGATAGKVYGQKLEHSFWPALQQSENQYEPPKEIIEEQQPETQKYGRDEARLEVINECPRTSDGPRQFIFWVIFLVISLGANFGLMMSVNYRTYAKSKIMDDKYLGLMGGIGAVACGMSRFIWGSVLQKGTFKFLYYTLCIINAFLAFTISFISGIRQIYFAYVVLAYVCYGGHLGMFPAVTSQIFGVRYGPQIYGILFYAFPASNFIQYLLLNYVQQGYFVIYKISGIMSICALLIIKKVDLKYDWSARIREHNERQRLMAR